MKNLQLRDTLDGGHLVFFRKDYPIDEGLYSELFCTLFSTKSADWLGDGAFNIEDYKIASRTENAISTYSSYTPENIALIKTAVKSDCDRFSKKSPSVVIEKIELRVYSNNALEIVIFAEGIDDTFNFVLAKTKQSLDNLEYLKY